MDIKQLDNKKIPKHIAVIMDGNGRWARKRGLKREFGHREGKKAVKKIVEACAELKIPNLTLFAFSTENWRRPKKEINYLFKLLENFLTKRLDDIHKQNIRIKILGYKKFSKRLNFLLNFAEKKTIKNSKLQINLALNYGSKLELMNAFKKIKRNKIKINEKNLEKHLQTKNIPDPDILIRTGNTKRLSNFLLWQLAYSEIFFEKKLWPAFTEKDFIKIINEYRNIKRNFGRI